MKIFTKSIPLQAIVILAVMFLLWVGPLADPQPIPADAGGAVLYDMIAGWLAPTPLLAVILAMMLILFEGVTLNLLLADNGLSPQNSLLPTLLYVVCMSAPATTLTPMVAANAMLIICLRQLMLRGTLLTISTDRACAATALIGLASMFYLPASLLMTSYMLTAINYRLYSWKDWAVLFLGFLAPYMLLATVLMFTDGLAGWWQGVADAIGTAGVNIGKFSAWQAIGNGALLLALTAGTVSVWNLSGERPVIWQKNATTLITFIVGATAMLFFTQLFTTDMQFFAIPFTFCTACLLMPPVRSLSQKRRKEWIFVLILILTIAAALIC